MSGRSAASISPPPYFFFGLRLQPKAAHDANKVPRQLWHGHQTNIRQKTSSRNPLLYNPLLYIEQQQLLTSSPMTAPNPKQLENALAFLTSLNALDWATLGDLMSPEFKHQYFPASIIPPDGKETRGKDEFLAVLKYNFLTVFEKVTFLAPPLDVIHGTDAVVFHLTSDGISKSGKKYNNEYMITFHFNGEKIIKLKEFVDSKYSSAFFTALRAESSSSS